MKIDLRVANELGGHSGGVYARVFEIEGRAYKVFRRVPDHPAQDDERRATFQSECRAYECVANCPGLSRFTPTFYGRISVEDVIDKAGASIGDQFLLDCCYAMEVLVGDCEKVTTQWWNSDEQLWNLREQFIDAQIFVDDADAFNKHDYSSLKLIDFRAV